MLAVLDMSKHSSRDRILSEELLLRVQVGSSHQKSKVEHVQSRDLLEEGRGARPLPGVVPGRVLSVELEVVHLLQAVGPASCPV